MMGITVLQGVFYVFATLLLGSAGLTVFSRHPVRAVLSLVVSFVCAAVLWLLLHAEFLALVLLFVYVGAVMTLFLFVVMMLNIERIPDRGRMIKWIPATLAVACVIAYLLLKAVGPLQLGMSHVSVLHHVPLSVNNTREIGNVLYTDYLLPFEMAGVLLLVAIVASISLAFRGRRADVNAQVISDQVAVTKASRLKVVELKSEGS